MTRTGRRVPTPYAVNPVERRERPGYHRQTQKHAPRRRLEFMELQISRVAADDRSDWEQLARAYKAFYKTDITDAELDTAWSRLLRQDGVDGLAARSGPKIVGITHYLFHTSTWSSTVCYLQDLFVVPSARGQGVARALIERVAEASRVQGANRLYWLTQDSNTTARALYDKLAKFNGFLRYDFPI